jgi:hypothetical protein
MSPFEHVATPDLQQDSKRVSNFVGWLQHRKELLNEEDYSLIKTK